MKSPDLCLAIWLNFILTILDVSIPIMNNNRIDDII